jgi:hypothetical protein
MEEWHFALDGGDIHALATLLPSFYLSDKRLRTKV